MDTKIFNYGSVSRSDGGNNFASVSGPTSSIISDQCPDLDLSWAIISDPD
jgi:hypothetical protein